MRRGRCSAHRLVDRFSHSDPLYLLGARQHELEHGVDRRARCSLFSITGTSCALARRRCSPGCDGCRRAGRGTSSIAAAARRGDVAHHEVLRVLLLVLDREHALDDERALDRAGASRGRGGRPRAPSTSPPRARGRSTPRTPTSTLRVCSRKPAIDGIARSGSRKPRRRLEARVVDRRHELAARRTRASSGGRSRST